MRNQTLKMFAQLETIETKLSPIIFKNKTEGNQLSNP